jgi:hypothetical protein
MTRSTAFPAGTTRRPGARSSLRVLGVAEAAAGVVLAGRPRSVIARVDGGRGGPPPWVVRLLGGRMVAQGLVEAARPGPAVAVGGAALDGSHALSMLALAVVSRRLRPPALASALLAGATAALLAVAARSTADADG